MQQALSNIRVLDLSRVLAGPWCTQNLADLGAEVIKVERPGSGDDTRSWGPPWIKDQDGNDTRDATYYGSANRNKKSIAIDISTAEGQALVRELAAISDVFIENYKVGDMARYGLAWDDLKKINPRLIYCSITGYGQDGPHAHRPGYDYVFQGIGGLMSITGGRDGTPGGGPQRVGIAVTDIVTGMYSALAITAALNARHLTGTGQYIDMALLDCIVAFGSNQAAAYMATGNVPRRWGNEHPSVVPYQVFETQDGHIIVAVGNDGQFRKLCGVIGQPALADDIRFAKTSARLENREVLIPLLQDLLRQRPSALWLEQLEAGGIPSGPINNYKQVFEDEQVRHRGLWQEIPLPEGGTTPTIASPLRLSQTPVQYNSPAPTLGQHTTEILQGLLGKSAEDIAGLKGIIQ
ncbi:CaiB/BaiF CoA transferase family protein [Lacisediminimonas profundi]|uniref:CaiB/BaiF CoA transferase family protein n=1 Tax=Lacisediminimonas profundi TaxID=2603856 RepID=UPI00124B07D7|nr:CaiB/BaiF CoA-transferase family protein [Lacisediminimonas profundi]